MHAATPRICIQTTIFSVHEVFEDCCHFYPFDIFGNKCENNEKIGTRSVHVARLQSFSILLGQMPKNPLISTHYPPPRPLFNVGRPTLSRFMRICIGIQKPTLIGEGGGGGVVYWLKK